MAHLCVVIWGQCNGLWWLCNVELNDLIITRAGFRFWHFGACFPLRLLFSKCSQTVTWLCDQDRMDNPEFLLKEETLVTAFTIIMKRIYLKTLMTITTAMSDRFCVAALLSALVKFSNINMTPSLSVWKAWYCFEGSRHFPTNRFSSE